MYVEEKILQENILTRDHIDELYSIFVVLCDSSRFKIIPADFVKNFQKIAQSKSISVNDEIWSQYFFQIDIDGDGRINFQDFLKYITDNFKLILGELNNKNSLNEIHSLCTVEHRKIFCGIISNFLLKVLNITNPFFLCDTASSFLPFYVSYTKCISKNSIIKIKPSDLKYKEFAQMIDTMNNKEIINEIGNYLLTTTNLFKGLTAIKKMIKPINYITAHFSLVNFITPIMEGLKIQAANGIFENILIILNSIFNDTSDSSEYLYILLKIIKSLLYLSNYLNEISDFCSTNNLNYLNNSSIDIKYFLEYINGKVIPTVVPKLNMCLNNDMFKVAQCAILIILEISKKGMEWMRGVITNSLFLDYLIAKTKNFVLTTTITDYNFINIILFSCIGIMEKIIICKEFSKDILDFVSTTIEKMNMIAGGLAEKFFVINNELTQSLFLVFLGLLSFKGNFDDRIFILKFIEMKIINKSQNNQMIYPFYFYIKCLLKQTQNKTSILGLISELKILKEFFQFCKTNENFISEFLDLINVIIKFHKNNLISSTIIREILQIFSEMLQIKVNNEQICNSIIKMLNEITTMKDIIINELILESELISFVVARMEENWVSVDFYYEFLLTDKKRFNTVMLDNGITFILNIINSDISKVSKKFISQFNIKNLQSLFKIYNDLSLLWNVSAVKEIQSPQEKQIHINQEIFEKFKDLPKNNLLISIIKIFDNLSYYLSLISSNPNFNKEDIDSFISFLNESSIIMKSKLRNIEIEEDPNNTIKPMPILKIFTQSREEANNKSYSLFEFPTETINFSEVISTIQENYGCEIELYIYENEGGFVKIKNENDFIKILKTLLDLYNSSSNVDNQKNEIDIICMVTEKEKKKKIITNCINCNNKIEIEANEKSKSGDNSIILDQTTSPPLCEQCKKYFFAQIAQQISINKTLNLSNINTTQNNNQTMMNLNTQNNQNLLGNTSILSSAGPLRVLSKTTFIDK